MRTASAESSREVTFSFEALRRWLLGVVLVAFILLLFLLLIAEAGRPLSARIGGSLFERDDASPSVIQPSGSVESGLSPETADVHPNQMNWNTAVITSRAGKGGTQ